MLAKQQLQFVFHCTTIEHRDNSMSAVACQASGSLYKHVVFPLRSVGPLPTHAAAATSDGCDICIFCCSGLLLLVLLPGSCCCCILAAAAAVVCCAAAPAMVLLLHLAAHAAAASDAAAAATTDVAACTSPANPAHCVASANTPGSNLNKS